MRTQKIQYIVNLTKQAISIIANAIGEKIGLEPATALFSEMEGLEEFGPNSVLYRYRNILMPTVQKMTSETLGKISAYGLGRGEVCKLSFRKISLFDPTADRSHLDGRKQLELLAIDVLVAAVCDRMLVLQLVKELNIKYELAGKKYMVSKA